jgi:hypothetical protein
MRIPYVLCSVRDSLSLTALLGIHFLPRDALAQGCAMCRTALSGDDPLSQGIFWSVMVLMAAPFLVAGSIGGWLFYRYRRAQRTRHHTASILPLPTFFNEQKEDQP